MPTPGGPRPPGVGHPAIPSHTRVGHSSREALEIVTAFLRARPDLDPDIAGKVKQSLDDLERTVRIRSQWR